jgi:hypothetical protein
LNATTGAIWSNRRVQIAVITIEVSVALLVSLNASVAHADKVEYVIIYEGKRVYTVSIMEFRDGKVSHETQYFADPFNAPAWRAQWVETVAGDNI